MEDFLLLSPLSRLPLGSLDPAVNGLPFLTGALAMKTENAVLPAAQMELSSAPAQMQRTMRKMSVGQVAGAMLVRGRL